MLGNGLPLSLPVALLPLPLPLLLCLPWALPLMRLPRRPSQVLYAHGARNMQHAYHHISGPLVVTVGKLVDTAKAGEVCVDAEVTGIAGRGLWPEEGKRTWASRVAPGAQGALTARRRGRRVQ